MNSRTKGWPSNARILSIAELAPELRSTEAWPGCIGGAISLDDHLSQLRAAGLGDVQMLDSDAWQPRDLSTKIKASKAAVVYTVDKSCV